MARRRWKLTFFAAAVLFQILSAPMQTTPQSQGRTVLIPEKERNPAPDFDGTTLEGNIVRLADFRGKVIVLNFWYIACTPCREEIPGLNTLVREFDKDEIVFVGLALDKPAKLLLFLKGTPFLYRIAAESDETARRFGVQMFPTHVLIDKNGRIACVLRGGAFKVEDLLRPLIAALYRESR